MKGAERVDRTALVAGRYRIECELARGGMAIVSRAFDESTGKPVVIKRLRPELAQRENIAMLFQREYHTLAQLSHPRIIEVYEYGLDDAGPYYTMEVLDGEDLRELAPLPWREACGYLRDVASSLALLHTRRLLHRDLSPRNVRRTGDGRAKLFDFGTMASFGVPRDVVGTAPLVPPEALRGVALDQRADLYSLGALAYWLLTRKHAYRAKRIEDLPVVWQHAPAPPSQFAELLPKELENLVLSLLSMDPGARPANAADVIERLCTIAGLPGEELVQAADSYLLHSSLVGREREMRRLSRRLERATRGRGSAVVVEANPGVGRSRLLDELSLQGQLLGAIVVSVTSEIGRGPYALARAIVRGLLRNAPSDTRHAAAPYVPVLGHLVPELQASQAELAVLPDDPAELRVRQQTALLAVIVELARERPLLLIADDFHRADEASAALLAALARYATTSPLMVVASVKLGSIVTAPEAVRAFRAAARGVRLHRLRRADTVALVESLFGSVPNVDRLANWVHDITTGNPTQTMELARHLVESGTVQYAEGVWVLPFSVSQRAVPHSLAQALAVRLATLSAEARELAAMLCVRDGTVSLALVAAVAPSAPVDLFTRLDELSRKGVLESSGEGYAFVHEALRSLLLDQLSPAERARAHQRMGRALLSDPRGEALRRLEGAWHLMRGGDELEGARIVSAVAKPGGALGPAVLPAVEEALRVLERDAGDRCAILTLRTTLVIGAYDHDRRLAYDYGFGTVRALAGESGLGAAAALSRFVGPWLGLRLGLLLAFLRRPFQSGGLRVARAVDYLSRCLANLVGALTISVDVEAVQRVHQLAAVLRGFPRDHACHVVYEFCRSMRLLMDGRENDHRAACEKLIERLSDPSAARQLAPTYRRDLEVGLLMSLGISEGYNATGRGLQVAERIEALGSYFGQVAAHRVRFIHHLMRGESELAEPHRRRVELHAVQGGSTWRVDLWSLPLEALAAHLCEDHVRLKQLAQTVGRLLGEVPSLRIFHEIMESRVQRRRGDHEAGLAKLERVVERMPPRVHMAWDVARLSLADALIAMDRPGRAREVCEQALREYGADDDLHLIHVMLARQAALAEGRSDQHQAARARLSALIERVTPTRHPLLLTRLHEAGVELALTSSDAEGAAAHLAEMERAVEPTRNPALYALYQSAAKAVRSAGLATVPEVEPEDEDDDDIRTQAHSPIEAKLARLLEGIEPHEWPERLLRLVLTRANVSGGYLYLWEDDELQLVATTLPDDPPLVLEQRIRAWGEDALEEGEGAHELSTLASFDSDAPSTQPFRLIALPAVRGRPVPSGVVAVLADGGPPSAPSTAFLRAVAAQLAHAS